VLRSKVVRPGLSALRLVDAAAEIADVDGLASVTVSEVARRFGVRPASIYSHIAGSDDLLDQLALLALGELRDRLAEVLVGRAGRAALVAFANAHRDYAREHPGRWAAAQRRLEPAVATEGAGRWIARAARAIMADYGLTADDETHAVRLLASAINGFVALEAGGSFDHSDPPAALSWERVLDAVDTSLRNWPTTYGEPR
jgi:AcrR family transcriptional regulator